LRATPIACCTIAAALAFLPGAGSVQARTLLVGPGAGIEHVADAARVAQDGDIVEILPGDYRGDVAVWTQKSLTIRGVGRMPRMIADGQNVEGKAIWVLRNGDFLIENIAFTGARVEDHTGAGIRFERGRLTVRNSLFTDNEIGLMTSNDAESALTIENSEFAQAPRDRGQLKHLLYVGAIRRLQVTGSRFHGGFEGHLIKSRARENQIRYNFIYDGPTGKAAYELEFPNGGIAFVIGNVVGQSRDTTNPVVIAYGAEGSRWTDNGLYLSHNTLISDRWSGTWFLRVWSSRLPVETEIVAVNNLTVGLGVFDLGAPGQFAGNVPLLQWALGDPDTLDFRLAEQSVLRGRGVVPPSYRGQSLAPSFEFAFPIGLEPIPAQPSWTPGAFQSTRLSP